MRKIYVCVKNFIFFNFIFINIWRFNIMINYSGWLRRLNQKNNYVLI